MFPIELILQEGILTLNIENSKESQEARVRRGELEINHHVQGLPFGGEYVS